MQDWNEGGAPTALDPFAGKSPVALLLLPQAREANGADAATNGRASIRLRLLGEAWESCAPEALLPRLAAYLETACPSVERAGRAVHRAA